MAATHLLSSRAFFQSSIIFKRKGQATIYKALHGQHMIDQLDKTNYRPVSVLPAISKFFEQTIFDQLSSFFENHFHPLLSAFRYREMIAVIIFTFALTPFFCGVNVAQFFIVCVVFCRPVFGGELICFRRDSM
jgi:hypothetical protein